MNIERHNANCQEEGLGRRLLQGQYNYYSSKRQGGEGETKECRGRGEECLCITSPNRSSLFNVPALVDLAKFHKILANIRNGKKSLSYLILPPQTGTRVGATGSLAILKWW